MKNLIYIIKYNLLIGMLLIGLSCDEASQLTGPNVIPNYEISMNVIGGNADLYADSCEGCQDPNPIEIQVSLKKSSVPVSNANITFTYESSDISLSDPFENSTVLTSTSGIAKAYYNDNGKSGTVRINATYLDPAYPDTAWVTSSDDILISPYYSLVNTFDLLIYDNEPVITAGTANEEDALEVNVQVKDVNGMPLQYMPILFYSDNPNVQFSVLEVFTDENGFATTFATHPQEDANGATSAQVFARLNYSELNEEQAQLSNRSFQIVEAPTPEGVFTLNISLSEETDYDVEDFDKNGDGIADGDYYYADGDVRLIKLTAQLEKDSTDTYFSVVNQPIAITVQGGSGDLVQEDGDDFVSGTTDGNGIVEFYFDDRYDDALYTFNASYDYGANNVIDAQANLSVEFIPYYLAVTSLETNVIGGQASVGSGYDDSSIDSITVRVTIQGEGASPGTSRPLPNMNIYFSAEETPINLNESLGIFTTPYIVQTDNQGQASITWEAYPGTQGGEVVISAVPDGDPRTDYEKSTTVTVTPPVYGDIYEVRLQASTEDDNALGQQGPILTNSSVSSYLATFTAKVVDIENAGIPGIEVDLNADLGVGSVYPSLCVTGADGSCTVNAEVVSSELDLSGKDTLVVEACVTDEALVRSGIINLEAEYALELDIQPNNRKNKKNIKHKQKKAKSNSFKISSGNSLNTYSSRNNCTFFAIAEIELINQDLYYIEQVDYLELYHSENLIIEDETIDTTYTATFTATTQGIPNVPINFTSNSEVGIITPTFGYTDENGTITASAIVEPENIGQELIVTASIENVSGDGSIWQGCGEENDEACSSTGNMLITKPIYNYILTLTADTTETNYSDDGITLTHIRLKLTTDDEVPVPLQGRTIITEITNNNTNLADGQLLDSNLEPNNPDVIITNSIGEIDYYYHDKGESGQIEIKATYIDEYQNSAVDSVLFEVESVQNIVEQLLIAAPNYVIVNSDTITTIEATVRDANGINVPNVEIQFQNGTDVNPALGQLNGFCLTDVNGQCQNQLSTFSYELGTAEIEACVEYETLEEIVALSGGTIQFNGLDKYKTKNQQKNKMQKSKKKTNSGFLRSLFSNSEPSLTSDARNDWCNGISSSLAIDFMTQDQMQCSLVEAILAEQPIAIESVEENSFVTVNYRLEAVAVDSLGHPVPNAPISFNKINDIYNLGTIIANSTHTDSAGFISAIYYPDLVNYDGNQDFIPVQFEVVTSCEDDINNATSNFEVLVENQTLNNVEYQVNSFGIRALADGLIGSTVKDDVGVGICNVPVYWELHARSGYDDPNSSFYGTCEDNDGLLLDSYISPDLCFNNGHNWIDGQCVDDDDISLPYSQENCENNGAKWITDDQYPPRGIISDGISYSLCPGDTKYDSLLIANYAGIEPGFAYIEYGNDYVGNSSAKSDYIFAYIKNPIENKIQQTESGTKLFGLDWIPTNYDLATGISIQSNPTERILINSLQSEYTATFTVYITDDDGAGVSGTVVDFENLTDIGLLQSENCTTGLDGSCQVQYSIAYNEINIQGVAQIRACLGSCDDQTLIAADADLLIIEQDLYYSSQVENLVLTSNPNTSLFITSDTLYTITFDAFVNGIPNVPIRFENLNPDVAPLSNSLVYSDESGHALITAGVDANDIDSTLSVRAYIEDLTDSDNVLHEATNSVSIEYPNYDYYLDVSISEDINWADNNATVTLIDVTLREDDENGAPIPNVILAAEVNNTDNNFTQGILTSESDGVTDITGKVRYQFLDNGQAGNITFKVYYSDEYNNTEEIEIVDAFEVVSPYGNASFIDVVPDLELILVNSTQPTYAATYTSYLKDDVGVGIPNESISYSNLNPGVGSLASPTCITQENGSCVMTVNLNYNQIDLLDSLVIQACYGNDLCASSNTEVIEEDLYYINQVEYLELYTNPNDILTVLEADSNYTISFNANTGVANVPVQFDNQSENIAVLSSPSAYTNENGIATVTASVNQSDVDNDFIVNAYIEDLFFNDGTIWEGCGSSGEDLCQATNSVLITYPTYTYVLDLNFDSESDNYSDNNNTITTIDATLKDENGLPLSGRQLIAEVTNNDFEFTYGTIISTTGSGLTDETGTIRYQFSDNGQPGAITINITYIDEYSNQISNSIQFTVEPIESLVTSMTLNSDAINNQILTTDTTAIYTTAITAAVSDLSGNSVQNVDVLFNTNIGQINASCITDVSGQCINNLYTDNEDNGQAQVEACVKYETLEELVSSSGGVLNFPELSNYQYSKNKKTNNIFSVISDNLNTKSMDGWCDDGITASLNLNILNQSEYYSEFVTNINLYSSDADDIVLVSDSTAFYNTDIFITVSDDNNAGLPSVPISLASTFGTISPSTCTTDASGNCTATLNTTNNSNNIGDVSIQACAELSPTNICSENYQLSFVAESQYYSDLVSYINITTDPSNVFITSPDSTSYTTNITITASDINNTGLPNVPINLSSSFGVIAPSTCTTNETGICSATLSTGGDNLGVTTIQGCATLSPNATCNSQDLEFMTQDQAQCNLVDYILTDVSVGEIIENNVTINVVDTLFARTLDTLSQPVANVPITFNKINDIYNIGYIIANTTHTDSLGVAYAVFYPDFTNYDGDDETIQVEFEVSTACENNDNTVANYQISLEPTANNVEDEVAEFSFVGGSNANYSLGTTVNPTVLAKDEFGVAICNVPIYWALYENDGLGGYTGDCVDEFGNTLVQYNSPIDCYEHGQWIGSIPKGVLSDALTYTECDTSSAGSDTTTINLQTGYSTISYVQDASDNTGTEDILVSYIKDPDENKILFHDELFYATNSIAQVQAWPGDPIINVTTIDSVYCDTLYAIALDGAGQALPEIPLSFQLNTANYDGVVYPINPITGVGGQPAQALYCPEPGFVGDVEINAIHTATGLVDVISISYVDQIPDCEDCIAELTITADEYILPAGENFDQTQSLITATMTDSLGYDPPVNTLCEFQAIQQNADGDWVNVGSIDEFSYFQQTADLSDSEEETEATTTFQMYDAAGLVTIVGTVAEYGLTDTIYISTISTQPESIEIIPPYPNEITVQGGGGIESTDVDVAIKDGTGNYISIPYWVRFSLIGAPLGCNMDGDNGSGVVDVLSQNGISTVSIISGTRPGAVQLRVELYPDNNGVIDDSDVPIASAESTPVTIATGPPAEGVINYSYVDITTIGGGLYQIPVSVDIWDIHSNPVADSTNVYFSVRGVANPYNEDQIYLAGDKVYWQSQNDLDSLVYECKAPLDVPAELPPPFNNGFEAFTCQNPDNLIPYGIDTDVNLLGGVLWEAQNHPANIEPVAKTGNESPQGESFPGKAWTYLYYSSSTMFDETVLFAQTYGADGVELVIDSRESHDGASLVLPFTPEGTIGLNVNPGSGQLTADAPELFVTVTASLTDYYQYYIDNGLLALTADGATIVNVCDGVDQNSDGTGVCFSDDNGNFLFDNTEEQLPFNTCTVCGENGGTWLAIDNELGPQLNQTNCTFQAGVWYGDALQWCGDGVPDDDPTYGITNNDGQVTWTIRYDLGINVCENCGENNAQCNDFDSNIIVTLLNPQGGASDPQTVTIIQPFPEDLCP